MPPASRLHSQPAATPAWQLSLRPSYAGLPHPWVAFSHFCSSASTGRPAICRVIWASCVRKVSGEISGVVAGEERALEFMAGQRSLRFLTQIRVAFIVQMQYRACDFKSNANSMSSTIMHVSGLTPDFEAHNDSGLPPELDRAVAEGREAVNGKHPFLVRAGRARAQPPQWPGHDAQGTRRRRGRVGAPSRQPGTRGWGTRRS